MTCFKLLILTMDNIRELRIKVVKNLKIFYQTTSLAKYVQISFWLATLRFYLFCQLSADLSSTQDVPRKKFIAILLWCTVLTIW